MNWQSLVIIGIIVILFIILMIINASTADLDQDNAEEDLRCFDGTEASSDQSMISSKSVQTSNTDV